MREKSQHIQHDYLEAYRLTQNVNFQKKIFFLYKFIVSFAVTMPRKCDANIIDEMRFIHWKLSIEFVNTQYCIRYISNEKLRL